MKQYLVVVLIILHLLSSSAFATKTFLDINHLHHDIDTCAVHEHHHHHHGSHHQHKHSHSQTNVNYVDFFKDTHNINLYDISNSKQTYLETISWIPNPRLESLFRPPKI